MEDDFAINRNGRVFHRTVQQDGFGLGAFTRIGYNLRGEFLMMTDPATAIKREVLQLVDRQIETLRHEGRMTDSALVDYHTRSEKIIQLYQEMDRMGRTRIDLRVARAS
jgi:hypothetical protein